MIDVVLCLSILLYDIQLYGAHYLINIIFFSNKKSNSLVSPAVFVQYTYNVRQELGVPQMSLQAGELAILVC